MKKVIIFFAIVAAATFTMAFKTKPQKNLKYKLEHLTGAYEDLKPYHYGKAWGKEFSHSTKASRHFYLHLD